MSSVTDQTRDHPLPEEQMGAGTRSVLVIANPASGGGKVKRLLPDVLARLDRLGIVHRAELTRDLDHAGELARDALGRQELPVAFSGDGVAGAVAAAAAAFSPDSLIGVLPGGSGNDFCRHTRIPQDPLAACELIRSGVPTAIDLGEANGRSFLGIASLGFDSEANEIANRAPRVLGRAIYIYGAIGAVLRWKAARFDVQLDGEPRSFEGWSVIAANTSVYGGGMFIAPGARIDDGLLEVVMTGRTSKLRFALTMPRVFKGTHVEDESVTVVRARELRVDANRPFTVFADGDPIAELPVTIRARPRALRVLLPA